jgi:hypothetical protein
MHARDSESMMGYTLTRQDELMNQPTTMDAAAKQRVKVALLEQAKRALREFSGQVDHVRAASGLDRSDTYTVDDLSQAETADDLGGLFARSVARQQAVVQQIEKLDFAPTDTVRPGALVGFGGARYVAGVVADEFECDGVVYEGISADSPLYAQIAGLRLGDDFTFNGQVDRIDFIA